MLIRLSLFGLTLALGAAPVREGGATPIESAQEQEASLEASLARAGVRIDRVAGVAAIPARVLVREDLLEYLLVGPHGQTHESLFLTEVAPSVLNAALLLLNVEPGQNARFVPAEEEGDEARVLPPEGGGFLLYAAWRDGDETYFFRVDDLISNLESGRSMRRHRWVLLGSRFAVPREGEQEVFVADLEGNHINICFFYQGNTLITAALPECEEQSTWISNAWLVPEREAPVTLVFAREPLDALPAEWRAGLEAVDREPVRESEVEVDDGR